MRFLVCACFLVLPPCFLFAIEQVVEVPESPAARSIFVNSKARKIYVGGTLTSGEWGLWVHDIEKDGTVTGTDERIYPENASDAPQTGRNAQATASILLSSDNRKLYLGVQASGGVEKSLVVYDLDEKGEPKGKPRAYAIGNFHLGISHMLVIPKIPFLYTIGWGGSGLFAMPLKDGEPMGEPKNYPFAYNAKTSLIPSDGFENLIFTDAGSRTLEVGNITPDGMLQLPVTSVPIPGVEDSLHLARVGHFLYFVDRGKLYGWPLNKEWRPIERPKLIRGIRAISLWEGVHSFLYVVEGEYNVPEKGKEAKLIGTKITRFKPDEKGNLGNHEYVSETFDKKQVALMTVDESAGTIYVNFSALP